MISIIDYGLGNINAFENIYRSLGIKTQIIKTERDLAKSNKIILPGVGSFDYAMKKLHSSGMTNQLNYKVLEEKTPILGVCVGMQMMGKSSQEGKLDGLGWLEAKAEKFQQYNSYKKMQLPHMGWNDIQIRGNCPLLQGLKNPKFYFLHSYFMKAEDVNTISATSNYGIEFSCVLSKGHIFATQFHPEKSHKDGKILLRNFFEYC